MFHGKFLLPSTLNLFNEATYTLPLITVGERTKRPDTASHWPTFARNRPLPLFTVRSSALYACKYTWGGRDGSSVFTDIAHNKAPLLGFLLSEEIAGIFPI